MIIGKVLKDVSKNGMTIKNVPYDKTDYPCSEGCCENELFIRGREIYRNGWLINYYMKDNQLTEFDINVDWSESVEKEFQEYMEQRKQNLK